MHVQVYSTYSVCPKRFPRHFFMHVIRERSAPKVITLFPCSTQMSTKFILLINYKTSTIVGILTYISMINTTYETLKQETSSFVGIFFISRLFRAQLS